MMPYKLYATNISARSKNTILYIYENYSIRSWFRQ
jgi:hypothetical protein